MCKAKSQGGQRCVGHASRRLAKAQENVAQVEAAFAAGQATRKQVETARKANWQSLVEYASTTGGAQVLRTQLAACPPGDPNAALLAAAVDDGALLAQANRRAENLYRAGEGKGPLTTPVPLTVEQHAAAERARVAEETARAAASVDPLGLRAEAERAAGVVSPDEAMAQTAEIPTIADEDRVPGLRPGARGGLPTSRPRPVPQGAPQAAPVSGTATAVLERPVAAEPAPEPVLLTPAQVERERARRERTERREATQLARKQNAEQRKLTREVASEVRQVKKWADGDGSRRFSAPPNTWTGPAHWAGGPKPTWRENVAARRAGRAEYGESFSKAMHRFAGEYTATDVLAACRQLDAQGRDKVTGRVRPEGWYADYETVHHDAIQSARLRQFEEAFGEDGVTSFARGYVDANLSGVLWRARSRAPEQTVIERVGFRARTFLWRVFTRVPA